VTSQRWGVSGSQWAVIDDMSAGKRKMSAAQLTAVAGVFSVLSEPGRLGLVQALRDGPLTVSELVTGLSFFRGGWGSSARCA